LAIKNPTLVRFSGSELDPGRENAGRIALFAARDSDVFEPRFRAVAGWHATSRGSAGDEVPGNDV